MADPLRAMLRVARAHLTDDGLRALAHARWPTAAPMSPDDIARLLLLIRRSRALRRRGEIDARKPLDFPMIARKIAGDPCNAYRSVYIGFP